MSKEPYFATHPTVRRMAWVLLILLVIYAFTSLFGPDRVWSLVEAGFNAAMAKAGLTQGATP